MSGGFTPSSYKSDRDWSSTTAPVANQPRTETVDLETLQSSSSSYIERLARCIPSMDTMHTLLCGEILKYRVTSYDNFLVDVRVHPAEGALPVQAEVSKPRLTGFDRYTFEQHGEPDKVMRVRPANGSVQIMYQGRWQHVSAYLRHLKPSEDQWYPKETQQLEWEQQARWWQANGKRFLIMGLPVELREIIYAFALAPKAEPYPAMKCRKIGWKGTARLIKQQPNMSLLRANRQIREEASHIFYLHTPFFIQHLGVTRKLFQNTLTTSYIRHLELALSHHEFLELFGFRFSEDICYGTTRSAHAFRFMRLDTLTIKFAAPSMATEAWWLDGACQVILADWIFEAAWPFIRGHNVTFTGFLKTHQKQKFEAKCLEERKKAELWMRIKAAYGDDDHKLPDYPDEDEFEDEEDGGVRLDGKAVPAAEMGAEDVEEEDARSRPICLCNPPCTVEDWVTEQGELDG